MSNVKLDISIIMDKYFARKFVSMLKRMEYNGKVGHSEWVAFFSDGDGAFRPKITIEGVDTSVIESEVKTSKEKKIIASVYDAS